VLPREAGTSRASAASNLPVAVVASDACRGLLGHQVAENARGHSARVPCTPLPLRPSKSASRMGLPMTSRSVFHVPCRRAANRGPWPAQLDGLSARIHHRQSRPDYAKTSFLSKIPAPRQRFSPPCPNILPPVCDYISWGRFHWANEEPRLSMPIPPEGRESCEDARPTKSADGPPRRASVGSQSRCVAIGVPVPARLAKPLRPTKISRTLPRRTPVLSLSDCQKALLRRLLERSG